MESFRVPPFGILTLHGGLKDNAIPRECEAEILIPAENTQIVCEYVKELNEILKKRTGGNRSGRAGADRRTGQC